MALKATVVRAELQVSDMDRHYYATHPLTLARHPSETEERLMVRLLAFAMHADERLEFGRGLSTDEDPDLWQRDYTGDIERWIEVGQPDEARLRKACARAREVVVLNYGGRAAELWWEKVAPALARHDNLVVWDLPQDQVQALTALYGRGLRLTVMIQDGEVCLLEADGSEVAIRPVARMGAQAA
ncbi:YaeQ family protein [Pseudoxanthomonas suwonensis]|uniref:YaeQ family protein n=1 Tax=Pseudoxanthomonas suwonensis TaxID=314722 RepID=UPI00048C440D|nr:YaeQ family protein [Pseudoxanthomonas suwonensis]